MTIIEPKVEYLSQSENVVSHVAQCARVCYGKESGDDGRLYHNLKTNKHWSMFRHATYYYIIDKYCAPQWVDYANKLIKHGKDKIAGLDVALHKSDYYLVINGNYYFDHEKMIDAIDMYEVMPKDFANSCELAWNMMRYTFKVTTQISTSRELNRVSPNNIAEQSTRYVDLRNGTVVRPYWMDKEVAKRFNNFEYWDIEKCKGLPQSTTYYMNGIEHGFEMYANAIKEGMKREDARGILPLDTATVCVYTYSVKEWKHIISLRGSSLAHRNAQIIANMIKNELIKLGYEFKD